MRSFLSYFWKDKVFIIALLFTIVSCFFITPSMAYLDYINTKVLIVMFTLMIAVSGFFEANLFSYIAIKLVSRFYSIKWIALVIVVATFFMGMWVTNDAVLLTLVPFTLYVTKQTHQERYALIIVILQTFAANFGSSLTPMGDPQNIYLYAFYDLSFTEFIATMVPITVLGFILLIITVWVLIPSIECHPITVTPHVNVKKIVFFSLIFINALLIILRVIPDWIGLIITCVLILPVSAHSIKKVDYPLILTFLFFFIFTGNIGQIDVISTTISSLLNSERSVFFSGFLVSQFISNVPASVLLSTFTPKLYWKPLLQSVNIGAMGTLIGSLASLITFKFVMKDFPSQGKQYLKTYTFLSIIFIIIIGGLVFCISQY